MSDIYAGEQGAIDTRMKRQLEEENKYKLAELMRLRDEEAAARAIKTKIANQALEDQARPQYVPPAVGEGQGLVAQMPASDLPGDFVPQQPEGMLPQEGFTGLGGMSTPQQGPVGLQPQEGLTGLGGMSAPTGMTPEQAPVQQPPAQGTLMSAFDTSEASVARAVSKVDQVKQAAMEMRKAGLHDQADAYELKSYKLQEAANNAQKSHLEVSEKLAEYVGSQANGYLKAIEDPTTNPDAAWQRMLLDLSANGVDIDEELALPPNQRAAYAEQVQAAAVNSKDQILLQKTLLQEQKRDARAKASLDSRERAQAGRLRADARKQEGIQARFEAGQDQRQFKNAEGILNKNITAAQADRREIDSQVKDLNFKITGIRSGTIITDETGKPYTRDARAAELEILQDRLNDLGNSREELTKEIDTHEEHLKTLAETFKKDKGSTKPVKLDKAAQSLLVEAVNTAPDQLETIKTNFKEMYPDLKFEDYVKINVNSKAFKKTK